MVGFPGFLRSTRGAGKVSKYIKADELSVGDVVLFAGAQSA
jgi:hypothetical protein